MKMILARSFRAAALVLALQATTGRSDEGSPSTRELDSRIDRAIYQTVNLGAVIFNQGDHAGCYRLYQGALLSLEPMLAHRAGVRQEVAKGLRDVDALPTYTQRAIELRRVLDNVLTAVRSGPAPGAVAARPLWDRLGGEAAVKAVVHDFVVLAAADPKVDFFRGGKYTLDAEGVANLERLLVELISAVSGGPLKYEGRDMKSLHEGMGITGAQFDAIAADLVSVLNKYQVPKKEADELVALIATTRKDIVEREASPTPTPTPTGEKPLWDRLGGEAAVKAVVHDFVVLATADPKVDFFRGGKYTLDAEGVANLERLLVELISAVSGGPLKYEGRDMKSLHEGMGITDAQFDAIAADLISVLNKYQVPKKEADELITIIASTRKDIVEEK
ncbi:MAG: group 1 truncated hemoglobin [Planctomycetaceae bacterium]|nr:group 1 truncated hemoglobin [Planctomycetaceae bacterium]